jgi:hypothetical protein
MVWNTIIAIYLTSALIFAHELYTAPLIDPDVEL